MLNYHENRWNMANLIQMKRKKNANQIITTENEYFLETNYDTKKTEHEYLSSVISEYIEPSHRTIRFLIEKIKINIRKS